MNELDDPMAYQQLQQQQIDLARQIATAARLRKEATPLGTGQGMPQGQMISGRYVAPAWSQMLAGTVNPMIQASQANQAEQAAGQEQGRLAAAVAQARERAIQAMPQVTPGTPGTPDQVAPPQGPPTQGGALPMAVGTIPGTPATPAALPSAAARAKWLAQASGIPGFGDTAAAMDKITGEEVTREDKQVEADKLAKLKYAELHQNKMLDLQKATMEIEGRIRTHADDNETRMKLEQSRDGMMAKIEQMRIDAGKYERSNSAEQARMAKRELDDEKAVERISAKLTPVNDMLQAGHRVQAMLDSYGPAAKSTPGMGRSNIITPWLQGSEGAQNRAAINNLAGEIISAKAGLSQTLSETERQAAIILSDPKFTEAQFRENWPHIVAKINNHITGITAGNPAAAKQYELNGGLIAPIKSKWPDAPKAEYKQRGLPAAAAASQPASAALGTPSQLSPADQAEFDALMAAKRTREARARGQQ